MTDAFSVLSSLNESLVGGRLYLFSAKPKDFFFQHLKVNGSVEYALVWNENDYRNYKKYLSEFAPDDGYNYIYRISKKLNIFRADQSHIQVLVRAGIVDPDVVSGIRAKVFIEKYCRDKMDAFQEIYDGFMDLEPAVFRGVVEKYTDLIDGNAIRFPGEPEEEQSVETENDYWMEMVLPALKHYTEKSERSLPEEVKVWLKENIEKPYNSRTLYRGFGIDFGGNWYGREEVPRELSIDQCDRELDKMVGLALSKIKVHAPLRIERRKESSWSLYPEVAEGFAKGWGQTHLNLLVKAEIPAEDIIIDLSTLPEDVKKDLKYWTQNEVIVENKSITARILKVWPNDAFKEWLEKSGYRIIPKIGVIPGADESYTRPSLF